MRGTILVVVCSFGCKAPPDAPEELDQLVGYFYEHHQDEDPITLELASYNLLRWLDTRLEETVAGYTVDNLSSAAVATLQDGDRDLSGLVGAAVGADHGFSVEEIAVVAAMTEQDVLYPDTYSAYEREYRTDPACFQDKACEELEFETFCTSAYALGLEVTTNSIVQWRWVDTEFGPAMVERSWLHTPAVVSLDWLEVKEQFYLWAFVPTESGSRSIQATWIVAELSDAEVPKGVALDLVVDSMSKTAETLEAYVAEQ